MELQPQEVLALGGNGVDVSGLARVFVSLCFPV